MKHAITAALAAAYIVGTSVAVGWAQPSPYTGGGSGAGSGHPRAVNSWAIEISKDGTSVGAGYCGVSVYAAMGGESCDAYVLCENPGTANFICSSGQIACGAAGTADDLAADIAGGLNTQCAGAVTASADGSIVTITAAANAESCVFSSEMGTIAGFALGLNVGVVGSQTCEARNVCDGVSSNEPSSEATNGGFSFTDAPIPPIPPNLPSIPTMTAPQLLLLGVLLMLAGRMVLRRARGHSAT